MHIFAGNYKNRKLKTPGGLKTRPTSGRLREALFNICQGDNAEARFLDLFAGSGAMGLEALSRGAKAATFVDNSRESIRCIQDNVQLLQVAGQVQVVYGDVFDVLAKLTKKGSVFDIIYADPPYDRPSRESDEQLSYSRHVLKLIDANIALLAPGGSLFLEDTAEALPKDEVLQHLVLKSMRCMGRSALQHYVHAS